MRPSTLYSFALVALTQITAVSAAVNPTRVIVPVADRAEPKKGVQSPSEFPRPNALTRQGCFSSGGNLKKVTAPEFLSSGSCGDLCKEKKFAVMALHGEDCLCGAQYPPKDDVAKDSKCNYPCPYYDEEACGALGDPGYWSVFNTGRNVNAGFMEPDDDEDEDKTTSSKTKSAASTAAPTTTSGDAPAATQTSESPNESDGSDQGDKDEKKSGSNTGAIAGGVVAGVVIVAAGIGGFFFWMRRRRNAEIEEDHRRNAAVNAFINGSKPPSSHGSISMTDSRLDPVMANRRMSDGSIADNQDYSRRILRVCDTPTTLP